MTDVGINRRSSLHYAWSLTMITEREQRTVSGSKMKGEKDEILLMLVLCRELSYIEVKYNSNVGYLPVSQFFPNFFEAIVALLA